MTITAACVFTLCHFKRKKAGRSNNAVFTTMLMLWGAALMWAVDCFASVIEGGELLDLTLHDAVLGAIVVFAALAVFGVLSLMQRRHAAIRS